MLSGAVCESGLNADLLRVPEARVAMSIIFSEDFNTPVWAPGFTLPAGWVLAGGGSGPPSANPVIGGCGYGNGVGKTGKFFISCGVVGNQASHPFTNTASVSLRAIAWFKAQNTSQIWEGFYLWCPTGAQPGFVFILQMIGTGQFSIRMSNVNSVTLHPSTTGVFPADGTPFALQWRLTRTSATSVTVAAEVNNVNVWSIVYTNTDNMSGINQWSTGAGTVFNRVSLLPISFGTSYNTGQDNLEIDDTNAATTWSVPASTEALATNTPSPTISSVAVTFGLQPFTITGTNYRSVDYPPSTNPVGQLPPFFKLTDPNGTDYLPGGGIDESSIVYSTTSITGNLTVPNAVHGSWCATVATTALCWETNPGSLVVTNCGGSPATLIVNKVTSPANLPNVFAFTTTGGLSPSTFNLSDGQSQTYTPVTPGAYGVTETPVAGIATSYAVSTGEPHDAFTVGSAATVTVTVSNSQGQTFPLRRARRFVLPFDRDFRIFLERLEYFIQVGMSPDAPIYTRLSKDGGQTFGAWQILTAGALGDYFKRVVWNVNSSGQNWIGELAVDAPYPWYLIDAFADWDEGVN